MLKPKNPEELIRTLTQYEAEQEWFEFKSNLSEPDTIGEYVSALSNAAMLVEKQFAYLIFGVEDETHSIIGTNIRLATMKKKGELFSNFLNRYLEPSINFDFSHCEIDGKRVEIITVENAFIKPVKFKNTAYIRVGSSKQRLDNCQEKERSLWNISSRFSFEQGIAAANLTREQIWDNFHCKKLSTLLHSNDLPDSAIFEDLVVRGLIIDNLQDGYDVTNLLALIAAKDLSKYPTISNKSPRVIVYSGSNKETAIEDIQGKYGYAVTFEKLLNFIMNRIKGEEIIIGAIRHTTYRHPKIAVREFLANALIHQNLIADGYGPRIEIFLDKIKFTNPGSPLIDTDRFIGAPAKSRNEKLAKLMRDCRLCEERGSGVERACRAVEESLQASPSFENVEDSTIVTLFMTSNFSSMSSNDRVRVCYQHAQLKYLDGDTINNASLRERLGLNKNQSASATGVINDTIAAGLIKPVDRDQANKNSRYVPHYAN